MKELPRMKNKLMMKKIGAILAVMMSTSIFIGCTSDDLVKNEAGPVGTNIAMTSKRDYQEALSVANHAISMLNDDQVMTRGIGLNSAGRKVDLTKGANYVVEKNKMISKSIKSSSGLDTLMYVFNYENNRGYAVVSACRNTEALIAVTDSGHFESIANSDNPGLVEYMTMATDYIRAAEEKPVTNVPVNIPSKFQQYKIVRDTLSKAIIYPRLKVEWGQDDCEGKYCPNGVSGCSITAAAMVMTYFKYPSTMALTYPGASVSSIVFDWNDMCNYKPIVYNNIECSNNGLNNIGHLCRQLGYLSGSVYYSTGGTGTTAEDLITTMRNLGYAVSPEANYSEGCLPSALSNNRLVIMGGYASDGEGHMWVVDGCYYCTVHTSEWIKSDGILWTVNDWGTSTEKYNDINWGWDGKDNGYFTDGVFDSYESVTNPTHINEGNFDNELIYFTLYHE